MSATTAPLEEVPAAGGEWAFVSAALPAPGTDASCDPGASTQTLALCDWAGRNSTIVVAEVVAVEAVDFPWFRAGSVETEDACDSNLEAAVVLTVEPLETLYGLAPSEPFSVYIGARQNSAGYPYAAVPTTSQTTVEWKEMPVGGVAPYAEGSTLLLALQQTDGERWSVMGEKIRTFTVTGTVVEPDEKECGVYVAPVLTDVAFEDLTSDLAECDREGLSSTATAAAAEKLSAWGSAERSYAALCHAAHVEHPEGYCEFQSMCRSGFVCQNNKCVQVDSN